MPAVINILIAMIILTMPTVEHFGKVKNDPQTSIRSGRYETLRYTRI